MSAKSAQSSSHGEEIVVIPIRLRFRQDALTTDSSSAWKSRQWVFAIWWVEICCDVFSKMPCLKSLLFRSTSILCQPNRQFLSAHRAFSTITSSSGSSGQQGPSFHKRPLPPNLVALSSKKGKQLFREAFDDGTLESYFPLAEQFITQSEPSYCSISSLAMVLNALNYDPKRIWKGSWRWVSEEMLHCESKNLCGHSEEKVRQTGMSFGEFETLTRCHGVGIQGFRACHPASVSCGSEGYTKFYKTVEAISRNDKNNMFMIVNYSRKRLSQTGDGHFSPIAAFHKGEGYVLVLDVARFKYPPYWVKIEDMWDAMAVVDKATNEARGYFLIESDVGNGTERSTRCHPALSLPHNERVTVCRGGQSQKQFCEAQHNHNHDSRPNSPCHGHDHSHSHSHSHNHTHDSAGEKVGV